MLCGLKDGECFARYTCETFSFLSVLLSLVYSQLLPFLLPLASFNIIFIFIFSFFFPFPSRLFLLYLLVFSLFLLRYFFPVLFISFLLSFIFRFFHSSLLLFYKLFYLLPSIASFSLHIIFISSFHTFSLIITIGRTQKGMLTSSQIIRGCSYESF
jgi:hypothetical protein